MSIASVLYRQRLIADRHNAEMGLLRSSASMRNSLNTAFLGNSDFASLAQLETLNALQQDQLETELKVIRAEEAALREYDASKNKSSGNKLNIVG